MFILNGQPVPLDTPFTTGGVNYPSNWIRLSSPADKAAIGMTEVVDAPMPDDFYNSVVADPVNHGQWIVTPYTPAEMKPRLEAYSRQKREARALAGVTQTIGADTYLIPTDYLTRNEFFNYRVIQERPGPPISTPYDFGTKVVSLPESTLLAIEQKMETRAHDCLAAQLLLQTQITAGTVTLKTQIDAAYAAVP